MKYPFFLSAATGKEEVGAHSLFSLSFFSLWLLPTTALAGGLVVVHGGGERWMKAVEARERGRRAVQFGLEENYRFLSPRSSSPLAGEGSCRWARGWLLEVESEG